MGANYYSCNSRVTRSMQIRKYLAFVDKFGGILSPVPCSPEQLTLYITWLSKTLKYSSILNYLSALNFFLKSEGAEQIEYDNFRVKSVLGGVKRSLGCMIRQAAPLLPSHLKEMFKSMSNSVGHLAIKVALLLSFRGLLRKSQVTLSDSMLLRSDFKFYDWGLLINVRRSKTIQFKERELLIPIVYVDPPELCAAHWCYELFIRTNPLPGEGAVRVPGPNGGFEPLTYQAYQATLKYFCAIIGLDPELFSSHSLRRGGCTFLAMQGATIAEIRTRGDWSSESVYDYIKLPLSERIILDAKVARALANL